MKTEAELSVQRLIDHVVDSIPGVVGALLASADGFVIASRLGSGLSLDAPAIAAMSAATLGLSSRLVRINGLTSVTMSVQRSFDSQVFVFAVGDAGALTVIADHTADTLMVERIGHELSQGLVPAFRRGGR